MPISTPRNIYYDSSRDLIGAVTDFSVILFNTDLDYVDTIYSGEFVTSISFYGSYMYMGVGSLQSYINMYAQNKTKVGQVETLCSPDGTNVFIGDNYFIATCWNSGKLYLHSPNGTYTGYFLTISCTPYHLLVDQKGYILVICYGSLIFQRISI